MKFNRLFLFNMLLAIFGVGPAVETAEVEISEDGLTWIKVGEISGGVASVDIGPHVSEGDKFSLVKLIDLKSNTRGDTPGADIDAIGAFMRLLNKVYLLNIHDGCNFGEADAILREAIANVGFERDIWKYFAIFPNIRSVGVKDITSKLSSTIAWEVRGKRMLNREDMI